jgi:hypothetical protein
VAFFEEYNIYTFRVGCAVNKVKDIDGRFRIFVCGRGLTA